MTNEDMPLFISNVTFEPGCRICWHIHTSDGAEGQQILICIAGEGWYVEEGKPTVELKEGVTVVQFGSFYNNENFYYFIDNRMILVYNPY